MSGAAKMLLWAAGAIFLLVLVYRWSVKAFWLVLIVLAYLVYDLNKHFADGGSLVSKIARGISFGKVAV